VERRNHAHIFGGIFFIFLAAGGKQELLILLLGGTKSLSQALVRRNEDKKPVRVDPGKETL